MMRPESDLSLPVVEVAAPRRPATPAHPGAPWLFAFWMALACAVAASAGLLLGVFAALQTGPAEDRWTQVVQAHGRLQLFGFAAPFIAALLMEFLPRLNQRPHPPAVVRVAIPACLMGRALLGGFGHASNAVMDGLLLGGSVLVILGALGLLAAVWSLRPQRDWRRDPQVLLLLSAPAWLVMSSVLSFAAVIKADDDVAPLLESRASAEVLLRGFALSAIAGVALRAFPGHLGLRPPTAPRQAQTLALLCGGLALWLAGQGFGPLAASDALARAGDLATAAGILLFTWCLDLHRIHRPWEGARYRLLVPVGWAGGVVYAGMLVMSAIMGDRLDLFEAGAVRHMFMLGFMTPVMVAMAHIVLARFGTGFVPWAPALTLAFWLVATAWPLRVIPALAGEATSDTGRAMMAVAGVDSMLGLGLVAAVCLRTARLIALRPAHH